MQSLFSIVIASVNDTPEQGAILQRGWRDRGAA
jgi:hypothetical protein